MHIYPSGYGLLGVIILSKVYHWTNPRWISASYLLPFYSTQGLTFSYTWWYQDNSSILKTIVQPFLVLHHIIPPHILNTSIVMVYFKNLLYSFFHLSLLVPYIKLYNLLIGYLWPMRIIWIFFLVLFPLMPYLCSIYYASNWNKSQKLQ